MKHKKKAVAALLVAAPIVLAPVVVRAYTVAGPSMAPTLWLGDRVISLQVAYDLRAPFTDLVVLRTGEPRRGDVVVYHDLNKGGPAIKRIVGLPSDTIELRDNRLFVNRNDAEQLELERETFGKTPAENGLSRLVASEQLEGRSHLVTYSPGASEVADHGPVAVPADCYFLLGDHRDNSYDSRFIGCITREQIKGRVVYGLRTQ